MEKEVLDGIEILSKRLAKNRGTPLNFFLSPRVERYYKLMQLQMSRAISNELEGGETGETMDMGSPFGE